MMIRNAGWCVTVIFSLIALVGCAAGERAAVPAGNPAAIPAASGAVPDFAGLLPPLPTDKAGASVFEDEVLGKDYSDCSTNALEELNYLRLSSPLNGISWGIWRFSPGPRTLTGVEAILSVDNGDEVYFALPDYLSNVWRFVGPEPGGKILELNDLRNKSATGHFYIGVITVGGDAAVVHKLVLTTEHPWVVTTVSNTNDAGYYTSLAEVNGLPSICYCEAYAPGRSVLRYVQAFDQDGAEWIPPQTLNATADTYAHTSLKVVNGNPAVSFQWIRHFPAVDAGGVLMYMRSSDIWGGGWGTPEYLDGDPLNHDYLGAYNSLTIVDGQPAISYYGEMHHCLKYIEASNQAGTEWQPKVTLDDDGDVGWYSTLLVPLAGQPMISYYDAGQGNVKGIAMNVPGTAWNPPFYIDGSADDVGLFASGALIYNDLAVCYYNEDQLDVRLARYNMILGDWVSKVVKDTGPAADIRLKIIAGLPAVCYYDAANGDLKYLPALDAGGQTWGPVETVDSLGNVGTHASLAEVDGRAAISYHDEDAQSLKFAIRLGP